MSVFKQKANNSKGEGGGNYEAPPADDHVARLVALIDLGTHPDDYQGKEKDLRKLCMVWELVACEKSDGTGNHFICRDFNVSFGKLSNLRKMVEKWANRSFEDGADVDLSRMLGQPFYLSLIHKESAKGNTYAVINDVSKLPKGLPCPPATVEPFAWEFGEGAYPPPVPAWVPYLYGRPVTEMIAQAKEARGDPAPRQTAPAVTQEEADWMTRFPFGGNESEIPF